MVAEAIPLNDDDVVNAIAPTGGWSGGQVVQYTDGRAAIVAGLRALAAGEPAALHVKGHHTVQKASGVVILKGGKVFFDISENVCTPLQAFGTGDFYMGVALHDAASTDTEVAIALNVHPSYLIDLHRDAFETIVVKTVVGSTTVEVPTVVTRGGQTELKFGTTAEAQKVDLLSKNSWPVSVPFIAEFKFAIYNVGDAAALDFNIGVANATHASDADSITESAFFHVDGNALDLLAESDDGTTEVNATDTTIDLVDDTFVEVWIDGRNKDDLQYYVNGVLVLGSTVFKLTAATGPLKLLAHMEKSSDDTPGDARVQHAAVRVFDAAAA